MKERQLILSKGPLRKITDPQKTISAQDVSLRCKHRGLVWGGCCRQDKQQQEEVGKQLIAQCKWLEDNIDSNGPFFMGEQFSLVASHLLP